MEKNPVEKPNKREVSSQPSVLSGLVGYENPHAADYEAIIAETRFGNFRDVYSKIWEVSLRVDKEFRELLKRKLELWPLVDLGCGVGELGSGLPNMVEELKIFEIPAQYIGIDKEFSRSITTENSTLDLTDALKHNRQQGLVTIAALVQTDMLDFISHLQDASVNITINGIDSNLDVYGTAEDNGYFAALAGEIERVIPPGGVVFGIDSDPILRRLNKKLFKPPLKSQVLRKQFLERKLK